MPLIAKTDFRYASRDLKAGEEFEPVSESDAKVLKAAGKAEDKRVPQLARKSKPYNRRDMRAEEE